MQKLTRNDLMPLEQYAEQRGDFRQKVISHKKNRQVEIGDNATLYFEDALTIQYQIQEMLRIEKIFEAAGIEEELDAYNPLIPDGDNLKATFMIEYPDVEQRKKMLSQLVDIENKTWIQVEGFDKVYPISNEDLERSTEDKTSAVHFMRFQFTPDMVKAAKSGANVAMGIEHQNYNHEVNPLPNNIRDSLTNDFA